VSDPSGALKFSLTLDTYSQGLPRLRIVRCRVARSMSRANSFSSSELTGEAYSQDGTNL
jgi:hypothetical protein